MRMQGAERAVIAPVFRGASTRQQLASLIGVSVPQRGQLTPVSWSPEFVN